LFYTILKNIKIFFFSKKKKKKKKNNLVVSMMSRPRTSTNLVVSPESLPKDQDWRTPSSVGIKWEMQQALLAVVLSL
jgi:hypothetical protein